jgi:hypothetical protein
MTDLEQRVQAWFGVGVEIAYAFLSFALVAVPALALGDDAFGGFLGAAVTPLALAFALAGTASFTFGDHSFERLGHFVVAAFGAAIGWVLVVSTLVLLFDLPIKARDPLPLFVAWTLSLATAGILVYYGDDALA